MGKKGIGLNEKRGLGTEQLKELNVAWYYNWNAETRLVSETQFVPMVYSLKRLDCKTTGDFVLGFNEPDNAKQSNIAVAEALAAWSSVASKAKLVGSPATARNAIRSDWMRQFMSANPKVDFITVHWYGGTDSTHFIKDLEDIHDTYHKPIWVTEFAPQTVGSSEKEPYKFTQLQVDTFIAAAVSWMESTSWVQRYAWHDSRVGTSSVFNDDGTLTPTGTAYAEAGAAVTK
jgi:hypothetical protein